jgi:hypothetical protein
MAAVRRRPLLSALLQTAARFSGVSLMGDGCQRLILAHSITHLTEGLSNKDGPASERKARHLHRTQLIRPYLSDGAASSAARCDQRDFHRPTDSAAILRNQTRGRNPGTARPSQAVQPIHNSATLRSAAFSAATTNSAA